MYLVQGDYKKVKEFCDGKFPDGYFEFEFDYAPENGSFREIDRFLWESKHQCTRYKNRYSGPVIIGLNGWNSSDANKYFEAFMYFLSDFVEDTDKCIFFVENVADKALIGAMEKHFDITVKNIGIRKVPDNIRKVIGFAYDEKEA